MEKFDLGSSFRRIIAFESKKRLKKKSRKKKNRKKWVNARKA